MPIPTEPIGSIPRPQRLLKAIDDRFAGRISETALQAAEVEAVRETILCMEETGSPVKLTASRRNPALRHILWQGCNILRPTG